MTQIVIVVCEGGLTLRTGPLRGRLQVIAAAATTVLLLFLLLLLVLPVPPPVLAIRVVCLVAEGLGFDCGRRSLQAGVKVGAALSDWVVLFD